MRNEEILVDIKNALKTEAGHDVELKFNETTGDYEFEDKADTDYGTVCYLIALNTMVKLNKLQEDMGITGAQHSIITNILDILINDRILTPIEDTEDAWRFVHTFINDDKPVKAYQCKRYSALFKHVYSDGSIKYNTVSRFAYKEPNGTCFHCGMLDRIAEKYFGEIKMPYLPEKTKVFDAVTFDSETGEDGCYDTMCIYDICGKTIYLDDNENSLTKDEFLARYEKYCDIRKSNSAEIVPLDMARLK